MGPKKITLDDEADKLFQELGGLDKTERTAEPKSPYGDLDDELREEEVRFDEYRIMLVDLTHLLSIYFRDVQYWEEAKSEENHFNAIIEILRQLTQAPNHDGTILIRYRGAPSDPKMSVENDYVVFLGNLVLDLKTISVIAQRHGTRASHLSGRLAKAFQMLSDHGISNIHIDLRIDDDRSIENLLLCLRILSRYRQALETNAPIRFHNKGTQVALSICEDERRRADINLTLLAGLNGMTAKTMRALVGRVAEVLQGGESSATLKSHASLYDAVFRFKNLKAQLAEPPITVNNARWLMVDRINESLTGEKAGVIRHIIESLDNAPHETVRAINSVYSNDYNKVSPDLLVSRLASATQVLDAVEEGAAEPGIEQEVLSNVQRRLAQVDDVVYSGLSLREDAVYVRSAGQEPVLRQINGRLLKMIRFFMQRSRTRQKVKDIITQPIRFDPQDFAIIGRDFGISQDESRRLITILQNCFDEKGHFRRGNFESNIQAFVQHERKVFEFLWYYAKKPPSRNDRVAFLNSLQLLAAQMQRPQGAVDTLLNDFYRDPGTIDFSDRNGLMLSTLLLRKYNKELNLDIELTPEEVLLVREGLNEAVVPVVSARLDEDQDLLFTKIRTIRQEIVHALDGNPRGEQPKPLKYLLSLERELHIFIALLQSDTASSGIRNAARIYGSPESAVYQMTESSKNLTALMQHLKVIVRALGRVGRKKDLGLLEAIRSSEAAFLNLGREPQYEETIKRMMAWVGSARSDLHRHG